MATEGQLSQESPTPSLSWSLLKMWTHPVPGSHESAVQRLPSSQFGVPLPGTQRPPEHTSPAVHALPSVQAAVLFVWKQPVLGLQPSSVQTFVSSQLGVPLPG